MAQFAEGQRIRVRHDADPPAPGALVGREGAVFRVIDFFDAIKRPGAPQEYMVWFDGDSQPKSAQEGWLASLDA